MADVTTQTIAKELDVSARLIRTYAELHPKALGAKKGSRGRWTFRDQKKAVAWLRKNAAKIRARTPTIVPPVEISPAKKKKAKVEVEISPAISSAGGRSNGTSSSSDLLQAQADRMNLIVDALIRCFAAGSIDPTTAKIYKDLSSECRRLVDQAHKEREREGRLMDRGEHRITIEGLARLDANETQALRVGLPDKLLAGLAARKVKVGDAKKARSALAGAIDDAVEDYFQRKAAAVADAIRRSRHGEEEARLS